MRIDFELMRALGLCLERPAEVHARLAECLELGPPPTAKDHMHVLVCSLCPYASVYLDTGGLIGGRARARIGAFLRAMEAPSLEEPDHLGTLLMTWSHIWRWQDEEEDDELRALYQRLEKELFWEHIASFAPAYLSAVEECGVEFYARWAERLLRFVQERAQSLGEADALPQHLAMAPPLAELGMPEAIDNFEALLAPVRSGIIVVRDELLDHARARGLGRDVRDRAGVLHQLLQEDLRESLAWLAARSARWADLHREQPFGFVSKEWATRAARTRDFLEAAAER